MVHMFLNGGGMSDGPLHDKLCGAPKVADARTAARYRFFSVADRYPALDAIDDEADGYAVAGEVYDLPLHVLHDSLLPVEPPELELGVVRMFDGSCALGMLLRRELRGSSELVDISRFGSWNDYLKTTP
ncbi:MAG: allophanate hydrolase-related protein [Stackebrandtia sp.]